MVSLNPMTTDAKRVRSQVQPEQAVGNESGTSPVGTPPVVHSFEEAGTLGTSEEVEAPSKDVHASEEAEVRS